MFSPVLVTVANRDQMVKFVEPSIPTTAPFGPTSRIRMSPFGIFSIEVKMVEGVPELDPEGAE